MANGEEHLPRWRLEQELERERSRHARTLSSVGAPRPTSRVDDLVAAVVFETMGSVGALRQLAELAKRAETLEGQLDASMDVLDYAWTIILNVSEGDWTKQNQEWQTAAARCREQYRALRATRTPKEDA